MTCKELLAPLCKRLVVLGTPSSCCQQKDISQGLSSEWPGTHPSESLQSKTQGMALQQAALPLQPELHPHGPCGCVCLPEEHPQSGTLQKCQCTDTAAGGLGLVGKSPSLPGEGRMHHQLICSGQENPISSPQSPSAARCRWISGSLMSGTL